MTQMESPKRKMQKKNDYQRHKLFRKIKRRRKAQAEAEQHIAEKQLKKKLKLPKFGGGKTREVYTSDIHFNNDSAGGGIDRYGNEFDYIQLPETVVTARKIPTFKDIEKQIGRKITQDEIDKVVAVDPEIPIQVPKPIEKGMYSPSITNELTNTIVGTAGDAINYLANKTGLPNLAPDEQLVETRDGDALFDLPGYEQAAKLGLYGLGRYGGKLGLNKLQKLAEVVKPYIKDEKKLRKQEDEILNNPDYLWSNELSKQMEDIQYKLNQIDNFRSSFTNISNMDRVTPKQKRSAMFAGNVDRIRKAVLQSSLDDYFEGVKRQKAHIQYNTKQQQKYLNDPENQATFMRSQGVLPRYDHPTYNYVLTITPGQHVEDMPNKMATKNMPLGPSQIAIVGRRGEKVVDLVKELSPEEISDIKQQSKKYLNLKKPSRNKGYKDTGDRIRGVKLSRKTKQ